MPTDARPLWERLEDGPFVRNEWLTRLDMAPAGLLLQEADALLLQAAAALESSGADAALAAKLRGLSASFREPFPCPR
jgi:hypothetical protein